MSIPMSQEFKYTTLCIPIHSAFKRMKSFLFSIIVYYKTLKPAVLMGSPPEPHCDVSDLPSLLNREKCASVVYK